MHASSFRSFPSSSLLLKRYYSSPSSCHLPYLTEEQSSKPEKDALLMAEQLAARCGATFVRIPADMGESIALDMSERYVLAMDGATGESFGTALSPHPLLPITLHLISLAETLSNQISAYASLFPSHLVILTSLTPSSSPSIHASKRASEATSTNSASPGPTRIPEDTPLPEPRPAEHYRLLSPIMILALGLVFGMIVPLALVVINALATIKSPIQGAKFKAPSGEKKNQ